MSAWGIGGGLAPIHAIQLRNKRAHERTFCLCPGLGRSRRSQVAISNGAFRRQRTYRLCTRAIVGVWRRQEETGKELEQEASPKRWTSISALDRKHQQR